MTGETPRRQSVVRKALSRLAGEKNAKLKPSSSVKEIPTTSTPRLPQMLSSIKKKSPVATIKANAKKPPMNFGRYEQG